MDYTCSFLSTTSTSYGKFSSSLVKNEKNMEPILVIGRNQPEDWDCNTRDWWKVLNMDYHEHETSINVSYVCPS